MAGMEQQRHLTVFGATSFVGQILTRYLYGRFGTDGDLRWAIAGRSEKKLRELHGSLYPKAAKLPQIVANAGDEKALREMCAESRVVISTVGPYALYGEPLVKICANTGTDYCDLTGEVQWIRRMIRKYEGAARASGARIVHCCGFDSIPSDLGVHFLQKHAMQKYGKTCPRVKLRVKAMRGGASGGTIASMLNVVKEASDDPELRRELANPYSLCPDGYTPQLRQPNVSLAEYDTDFKSWIAPFVMAAINTRIVHRTNALSKQAYGADFRYDEAVLRGDGFKGRAAATSMGAGLGAFMAAAAVPPTRWVLERFLPGPGEGPIGRGAAQRLLRHPHTRPHGGPYAAGQGHRRSRSRLWIHRQDARPGGRLPRARHAQGPDPRRLLDTGDHFRRPAHRPADQVLGSAVRIGLSAGCAIDARP